jgi:hypothetical protein
MTAKTPIAAARANLSALIRAAAAGRADLDWLRKVLADAGYIQKGDRATKTEVETTLKIIVRVIEDLGLECAGTCGDAWLDKVQRGIERLNGGSRESGVGSAEPTAKTEGQQT